MIALINLKPHCSKAFLQAFSIISLVSLLTINILNPAAYGHPSTTCLFINPPMYIAEEVGEVFEFAVNISDVEDLRSFEFTLSYNVSLLDVVGVRQGSFFPAPPRSYFQFKENESLGSIKVNMSLASLETPRSGGGVLAWIDFEVAQGPELCDINCGINIEHILLLNHASVPIVHDSVGAIYFWKSTQPDPPPQGRYLDLCTQKGGEGLNQPGGHFDARELVFLTSEVLYNGDPIQNVLVAFQVLNPLNETVLVLVARADQNGLATINFRIPNIPSSEGLWQAISVVSLDEKIVWDTLTFRVRVFPVGGYSFPLNEYVLETPLTCYLSTVTILIAVFTMSRRRIRNRRTQKNWDDKE